MNNKIKRTLFCIGVLLITLLAINVAPSFSEDEEKTPEDFFLKGRELHDSKKYSEAIDSYTRALDLKPNFIEAYYGRGASYGMLGDQELAIKDFDKIIELNPGDAQAYYNKAVAYEIFSDFVKAVEQYKLFLKHSNFQTPVDLTQKVQRKIEKLERKIEAEKKALEENKKNKTSAKP